MCLSAQKLKETNCPSEIDVTQYSCELRWILEILVTFDLWPLTFDLWPLTFDLESCFRIFRIRHSVAFNLKSTGQILMYSVSQKSSPPPKKKEKLFAIFLLVVNLCNWKLSWLLPRHTHMFTPILVLLSEYLYELYHFY